MQRHLFYSKASLDRGFVPNQTVDIIKIKMTEGDYSDSDLSDSLMAYNHVLSVVAYSYGTGDYCGYGHAIFQTKDGKWDQIFMSHCSCNGPMEHFEGVRTGIYNSLDDLVAKFSTELNGQTKEMVDALKSKGYK